MARPQKNIGFNRITKPIVFDPRVLQVVQQLSIQHGMSISMVIEKSILANEGVETIEELCSIAKLSNPGIVSQVQPLFNIDQLNKELFALMDKKNPTQKDSIRMNELMRQINDAKHSD